MRCMVNVGIGLKAPQLNLTAFGFSIKASVVSFLFFFYLSEPFFEKKNINQTGLARLTRQIHALLADKVTVATLDLEHADACCSHLQ